MDQNDNIARTLGKVKKGSWSDEEDELLCKCIEKYGEGNWKRISERAGVYIICVDIYRSILYDFICLVTFLHVGMFMYSIST